MCSSSKGAIETTVVLTLFLILLPHFESILFRIDLVVQVSKGVLSY